MSNQTKSLPSPQGHTGQLQFIRRQRVQATVPHHRSNYFVHHPMKVESRRQGYPRLAAFVNSDKDFVVFRSFGELQARILLYKQDEIVLLEERLHGVDSNEMTAYNLNARRHDQNVERKDLVSEIESKLNEYHKLLRIYFQQVQRPRARKEPVRNLSNWMDGNKPVIQSESTFLDDWDDLVSPDNPADKGGLDQFLERSMITLIQRGFRNSDTTRTTDSHVLHFSHSQITAGSRILTTILAVATLVGPIVVLFHVNSTASRLWIIAISTGMFSSALCSLTQSRNYEIFSATAGYCAVMVVFVGSLPGGSNFTI